MQLLVIGSALIFLYRAIRAREPVEMVIAVVTIVLWLLTVFRVVTPLAL